MSSDATSAPPPKRVRFDSESTSSTQKSSIKTKPSIKTLSPSDLAKSNLTTALASLVSTAPQFFKPLTTELLNLRLRQELRTTKLKQFDESTYLPRSIRLKTSLNLSTEAKNFSEAEPLHTRMQDIIATFEKNARQVILEAALLEIKATETSIATTFVTIVLHACSYILIKNSISQKDETLYLLAAYLIDRTDLSVTATKRDACFQQIHNRFPSQPIPTNGMAFDDNFVTQLSQHAKTHSELYTMVDKLVNKPWKAYTDALTTQAKTREFSTYFVEQATTSATENAAMLIDSDPIARNETLTALMDQALAKQAKKFEQKYKSLENTLNQLKKNKQPIDSKNNKTGGTSTTQGQTKTTASTSAPAKAKKKVKQSEKADVTKLDTKPDKRTKRITSSTPKKTKGRNNSTTK